MKKLIFPLVALSLVAVYGGVSPLRSEVYIGAAGGLLLGLVGFIFAIMILRNFTPDRAGPAPNGDIWGFWTAGMLVRLALLGPLCYLFSLIPELRLMPTLLSMTAVYLVLLFCESAWLCERLSGSAGAQPGQAHG